MKGICFIEPLFNKVVTGEKIQTRRIIKMQPREGESYEKIDEGEFVYLSHNGLSGPYFPPYKLGSTVYLKEPYAETCDEYGTPIIAYKFGGKPRLKLPDSLGDEIDTNWCIDNYPACGEWKNKLFMPQWAARYFIEITGVRAERLQDISEEDCLKEGIEAFTKDEKLFKYGLDGWEWSEMPRTAREAYATLINGINGKGTWEQNPWVWVYDFELINK